MTNIIEIIKKYSLTVRCLPHVAVSHTTYREGDEANLNTPRYDSQGNVRKIKRKIIFSESWNKKLIREERKVDHGGWWYVKETQNTDSIVRFDRRVDKFFAPTLEEAIQLYLDRNKKV